MPPPRNSLPRGGRPRRARAPDELVLVPLRVTAHDRERMHDLASRLGVSLSALAASIRDAARIASCRDCPLSGDGCGYPRPGPTLDEVQASIAGGPSPASCPLRSGGILVLPG